jgi:pyruvate ferredoxin oxidoreductase gamma subunit
MMAFVRIAREPILERGAIARPHLVVVSDETLLEDPASTPLAGCAETSILLLNGARDPASWEGRTFRHDLSDLALRTTSSSVSLSTALGAAAACLAGIPLENTLEGVEDELSSLGAERLSRNLALACEIYGLGAAWPLMTWPEAERALPAAAALVDLPLDSPRRAAPSIYATANTPKRTGSWRQLRPVLEEEKCNCCWLCFVSCPEGAIALDEREYPRVDLDVCKGCLLCVHECPTHAFRVEREARTSP